jgi:heptose I phosphotransferase
MMQTEQGRRFRKLTNRESRRLELHDDHGRTYGAYLKRHWLREHASQWRTWLGLGQPASEGRREAENAVALARDGIPTLRTIAWGERPPANNVRESFVVTEELTGYEQLDFFLRQRFEPTAARGLRRDPALDRLLDLVADLARQFHDAGYNHRDLYCCHFFVAEPQPGQFDLKLIDLQRVQRRWMFQRRWVIKDLAQLSYSAPRERISATQRMRMIRRYLRIGKLDDRSKRFIRLVLAKHAQMERRLGAHP